MRSVGTPLAERVHVVKVRCPSVAVGAAIPPAAHDLGSGILFVLDAVRRGTSLLTQGVPLVLRKLPVVVLDIRLPALVPARRASAFRFVRHFLPPAHSASAKENPDMKAKHTATMTLNFSSVLTRPTTQRTRHE